MDINMFSKEVLSRNFETFRPDNFNNEQSYLNTALLAFEYILQDHQQLTVKFKDYSTEAYKDLNRYNKRSNSLSLFLKLMLDTYISSTDNPVERHLLTGISETLANLYLFPSSVSNETITQLTTNIIQWLENYTPPNLSADSNKQQLCKAIFLTIICLQFKCQRLKKVELYFFKPSQDNLLKLAQILEIINGKIGPENNQSDEFLNLYFQQFDGLEGDTIQVLQQISSESTGFKTRLNRFLEAQSQLTNLQNLLAALNHNQTLRRPLYCHQLIENNPESTATLSLLISPNENDELNSCYEKTKQRSYANSAKQYASSIFSYSNSIFRNNAPQIILDSVNYYAETPDSKAKRLLKAHCKKAIETLQTELSQETNHLFKDLKPQRIEELKTVNESTLLLATKYQKMYNEIQEFKQTHLEINKYIETKDTLFGHVIDFIKRFVNLFSQTSLSEKIGILKTQQTELKAVIQSFEQDMGRNRLIANLPSLEASTTQNTSFQNLQNKISLFRETDAYSEYSRNMLTSLGNNSL